LTGAAWGSDVMVAATVLEMVDDGHRRPDWLVAAILPFGIPWFLADFDQPERCSGFDLVMRNPCTRVYVLPPLRLKEGQAVGAADLTRYYDDDASRSLPHGCTPIARNAAFSFRNVKGIIPKVNFPIRSPRRRRRAGLAAPRCRALAPFAGDGSVQPLPWCGDGR
jgi:hypothetical protein